jgi:AraC family transcriptional regulator
VAGAGGFSSSANFSKAFKLYFGLSPSELRKGRLRNPANNNSKIGKLYRKYGKVFNPADLYSQFVTQDAIFEPDKLEDMFMQVRVEDRREQAVAYLTSPKGYELDSVYATWDKISRWASLQGIDETAQTRYAVCHDNPAITPLDKCRYDAAIVVDPEIEILPPYTRSAIPAGRYAIFHYKDDAGKINHFMTELCSHWFPDSGYEPDNFPPVFNYLNDSRQDGYVEMDIYIKLKELQAARPS